MRNLLEKLYQLSGLLAVIFFMGIAASVLVQVVATVINGVSYLIFGFSPKLIASSYTDFAGYFFAASTFLSLAHTFRKKVHIRVTIVMDRLSPIYRNWLELFSAGVGILFTIYFIWFMIDLVHQSLQFHDISYGMTPIPLWIPQLAMVLGLVIFAVALIDWFISVAIKFRTRKHAEGID